MTAVSDPGDGTTVRFTLPSSSAGGRVTRLHPAHASLIHLVLHSRLDTMLGLLYIGANFLNKRSPM